MNWKVIAIYFSGFGTGRSRLTPTTPNIQGGRDEVAHAIMATNI